MKYLVLGATGYLGSYIYRRLQSDGRKVAGTARQRDTEGHLLHFDILTDPIEDLIKSCDTEQKTAVFCIAQPNIDRCKKEFETARQINVVMTKKVIQSLLRQNYYVIFFSTDNVFDGSKGAYTETDQQNAINQYGKMKQEMEQYLVNRYPQVCIFRLPRVIGTEAERQNLLTDYDCKKPDEKIRCIKDTRISIVAKEDVYQACRIATEKRLHGIYNLSSGEEFSRKELAERFFCAKNVKREIVELELDEFGFQDVRPLHMSLNNEKFIRDTAYHFTAYDSVIEQYLKNLRDEK